MSYQKLPQQMIGMALVFLLLVGCGAPAAKPKLGATLVGTIAMDRAKSAQITLRVSDDGQTIEWVRLVFTEVKCEGFSAGSARFEEGAHAALTDGKFELESSSFGEISGQFTSPTAVHGTVHFTPYGECGTWEWSATGD